MRILAIRPRALGDVVLITPALRALTHGRPGVELEVATEPRYRSLIEGLEGVSRVWDLERGATGTLRMIPALRRRRFEWAVDFFGNPRTALIARLSGARRTAGFELRGRGRLYDVRVPRSIETPRDPRIRREYAAAVHVRLAEAAGGKAAGLETRVPRAPGGAEIARHLMDAAGVRGARPPVG